MRRILCLIAAFLMFLRTTDVFAHNIESVLKDTADYAVKNIPDVGVSPVGGEWVIIALARSGQSVPIEYFDNYYNNVITCVKENNGVLHERKYTEYSRVVIALTAIDKDPANVSGYNLIRPLEDFDKVIMQGLNGPIWALIALDSGSYETPDNPKVRQMYVEYILGREIADGGWALNKKQTTADVDITAMALVALSNYKDDERVKEAIERGINALASSQSETSGYVNYNISNCESVAQVITALSSLGITCKDSRFVKNGYTLTDSLLSFYKEGSGFSHNGENQDLMATEQALCALVAMNRLKSGQKPLFDMSITKEYALSSEIFSIVEKIMEKNYEKH